MRTTLTLEKDVAAKLADCAAKLRKPTKDIVNSALRIGLERLSEPVRAKPYKSKPHHFGLRPGLSYDNIGELLEVLDLEESP